MSPRDGSASAASHPAASSTPIGRTISSSPSCIARPTSPSAWRASPRCSVTASRTWTSRASSRRTTSTATPCPMCSASSASRSRSDTKSRASADVQSYPVLCVRALCVSWAEEMRPERERVSGRLEVSVQNAARSARRPCAAHQSRRPTARSSDARATSGGHGLARRRRRCTNAARKK